ncbi:MAG: hypothetical protein JWM35_734, partial [Verrucomicrobia bacterium]|nr:hypothetical protein [Verrucomicrobiota bacterium]
LKKEWYWLKRSRPGERFQSRYRRTRRARHRDETAPRVLRLILAVLAFMVGICVIPLPFPEIPFFLVSGALLATESLALAKSLDRLEKRGHNFFRATRRKLGLPPSVEKFFGPAMLVGSLLVTSCIFLNAIWA